MIIKSIIKKFLPKTTLEQYRRRKIVDNFKDRFDEAIQVFVVEKGIVDDHEIQSYRKKLKKAFIKDNWYPNEYFFFNYERLSEKGRKEFVPNREAHRFWVYANTEDAYQLTCDKWDTYLHFKKYYKRECLLVNKNEDEESFLSFAGRHARFIVKPSHGNLGNGVKIVDSPERNHRFFADLLSQYPTGFIAEELILQSKEFSEFHPSSVNTIRITTVRLSNGDIHIIHRPFARFGQGGRCVDNGGNYGIFGGIDFNTGIINASIDERMNRYVIHPDSGKTILGFQIPRWEEAKALVVELANVLPDLNYCGWDLALTDEGWVMVEANGKGLFIGFQMPMQEGFRNEFEYIKQQCNYKE